MSDPRLTQTNHFGRNDRGAQIGHLENFFNFSMHGDLSGSEYGNDADVEKRCLRSLATGLIYIDRQSSRKVPGTGDWVLQNEVYQAWQQNGGILWIKGRAGCGKSMLISHLSSEAKRRALEVPNTTVLSHSFVFGKAETLQRSPAGLFRGVLHQILATDRDTLTCFTKATDFAAREKQQGQAGVAWDWLHSELHEQLDDICRRKFCQPRKACLYIDCLDACNNEDAIDILEWLNSLATETGNGSRICFSSRPYPKWQFDKLMCLNLEELNQSDMVSYLDFHLKKLQKPSLRGDAVKEEDLLLIKDRLLDRASSVFQWLKYAICQATELLQSGESVNYVLDVLEKCPQDLDEVYVSIVEQIPKQETDVAFRLLEWITLAQRPLPVQDLRLAICIDRPYKRGSSIKDLATPNKHWCENDELLVLRAEQLTRGLVRLQKFVLVHRSNDLDKKATGVQALLYDHESVLEFLVIRGLRILASRMGTNFTLSRSHFLLAQRCLAYLSTREGMATAIKEGRSQHARNLKFFAGSMGEKCDESLRALVQDQDNAASAATEEAKFSVALTDYAAKEWRKHYLKAESDATLVDECLNFLQSVCGPDLWEVETWFNPFRGHFCTKLLDGRDRVVDIICLLGFVNTLNRLLSRHDRESETTMAPGVWREVLNTQDQYGVTPLIAAICGKFQGVVELLLQHGASANITCRYGMTPLNHAVVVGRADIVDLLLALPDINPDGRGDSTWSPLMNALILALAEKKAQRMHILESLVRATKESVHSVENPMRLPATLAKLGMNRPDNLHVTPLAMAWLNASGNILKILLKCPLIDPSAQISQGRTLAHYIAEYELSVWPNDLKEELVETSRILFDSGRIALDTKDCWGDTPLAMAAIEGNANIVSMLLAKGEIEANSKNNCGLTPLLLASQAGNVEILKILLASKRVNRHEVDEKGRNALANAVVGGVFEAVRLLMGTGQFHPDERQAGRLSSLQLAVDLTEDPNQDRKAERVGIREFLIRT